MCVQGGNILLKTYFQEKKTLMQVRLSTHCIRQKYSKSVEPEKPADPPADPPAEMSNKEKCIQKKQW